MHARNKKMNAVVSDGMAALRLYRIRPRTRTKPHTCACPRGGHAHLRDVAARASTSLRIPHCSVRRVTFGIAHAHGPITRLDAQHAHCTLHITQMLRRTRISKETRQSLLRNMRIHVTRTHVHAPSNQECTCATKRLGLSSWMEWPGSGVSRPGSMVLSASPGRTPD